MRDIIIQIISTYYFAFAAIIFGVWKFRDTIKNTPRNINSSLQPFTSGIAAAISFIVMGILIIYFILKGEI
jgi:hypothetical protein